MIWHPNIQGHWRFQENGNDENNSNNCAAAGSPTYGTGVTGSAVITNSTGYLAKDSGVSGLGGSTGFTMFARCQRGSTGVYQRIINIGNGSAALAHMMQIQAAGDVYCQLGAASTYTDAHTTGNIITDTNWHDLAVTYDSGTVNIYVDGDAQAIAYYSHTLTGALGAPTTLLRFGATHTGATPGTPCTIDEVQIYNFALGPDEIKAISQGFDLLRRV